MTTVDDLRERSRQSRVRLQEAQRLRTEQRLITAQTDHRLRESRRLLEQCEQRGAAPAVRPPGEV